ncbi:hypothetical protein chiPu_0001748 [Chiloscyllium punctatum]|uniref:Uncharacterized protein n=1 Tax=Chiloscyllium punctatum TaxID=137246 RepID=A0A401RYW5_CHIPU|nr:hypothetical protein [Chiloscyllium punctatum]
MWGFPSTEAACGETQVLEQHLGSPEYWSIMCGIPSNGEAYEESRVLEQHVGNFEYWSSMCRIPSTGAGCGNPEYWSSMWIGRVLEQKCVESRVME